MSDRELELAWALIRERRAGRLSDAQLADLRASVEGLLAAVRELRRVSLSNADAPAERPGPSRMDAGGPG